MPNAAAGRTAFAGAATAAGAGDVVLRRLASQEDYAACVALQRRTWGRRFQELVPPSVLKVSQRVGSLAAGAFDQGGGLLGFVFGLTGVRPHAEGSIGVRPRAEGLTGVRPRAGGLGSEQPRAKGPAAAVAPSAAGSLQIVHWSHMLAVSPEARDRGLGTRLKLYQRELLLPLGVEVVEWTYDPLVARNAHLNLNHLGAEAVEYVENMYRGEMGSVLARGIGSDRFVVAWRIGGERVAAALAGSLPEEAPRYAGAPRLGLEALPRRRPGGGSASPWWLAAPRLCVEVPGDIQTLKAEDPPQARRWRFATRLVLGTCLARGWRVEAFFRERASGRCYYGLAAPD